MLQPPTLQVDEHVVKQSSRGMGWWDLFHIIVFFGSKSWIQKKSCNPGRQNGWQWFFTTENNLRLVLKTFFCYHWPGLPRFLKRLKAEVTTASLQMSRALGLKGRAREVDSKQLWGFFKTRKIPDKAKVKIQKSGKKTSAEKIVPSLKLLEYDSQI